MQKWSKAFPAGMCIAAFAALTAPQAPAALQRTAAPTDAAASFKQLQILGGSALKSRTAATSPALNKYDSSLLRIKQAYESATAAGTRTSTDVSLASPMTHVRYTSPLAAPSVLVDAIVSGDAQQAKAQLQELGFEPSAVFGKDIGGWLPVDRAADIAALGNVRFVKTAMMRVRAAKPLATLADPVAYEGDFVQGSQALKQATGLNGSGITVGVLSDSFNCNGQFDTANPSATHRGNYADDVALGALPAGVNVIKEDPNLDPTGSYCTGTDEGRALAQIIYAVAPSAKLAFYTADGSEADFAQGILTLALPTNQTDPNGRSGGGAQVIDDDVGYADEPVYQEGEVGTAIDSVATGAETIVTTTGSGSSATTTTTTVIFPAVAYFSSAGNDASNSYENDAATYATTAVAAGAPNAGEHLLTIATDANGNPVYALPITIPRLANGDGYNIALLWDQPYASSTGASDPGNVIGDVGVGNGPGATSVMDICIGDVNGNIPATGTIGVDGVYNGPLATPTNCAGPSNVAPVPSSGFTTTQPGDNDPYNFIQVFNTSGGVSAAVQATLIIGLVSGPMPDRVKVIIQDDGRGTTINKYATNSSTIQGHPLSPHAMAVAAMYYDTSIACGQSVNTLEFFSSTGGSVMLFNPEGAAISPYVPQKPDITAPDGITTSFFGYAATDLGYPAVAANAPTQCQTGSYTNDSFFGTSAAAPHAAGLAALMLQADPTATPAEIYYSMRTTTAPVGTTSGFNFSSGYGLVQAQAAKTALDGFVNPPANSGGGGGGGAFSPLLLLPGLLLARLRRRKRA